MTPLLASSIRGNWATLLLPINRDESIDFGLLAAELDLFISARVDGIYSNGSAGEFYTQTEEEFDRVSVLVAERCSRAGLPFQIGACHMSPQLSLERIRRARALGPGAFQVVLPDWFPPTIDEIVVYLETLAREAAPVPLVVYNPPHAKYRLTPAEWLLLVEKIPAIVGIKVPGTDEGWFREMRPVLDKISVFIPGHTLASGLRSGARGAYSNVACLSPRAAQRWYELCLSDPTAALREEQRIQAFWSAHVVPLITERKLPNMAADKANAVAGKWLPGLHPRLRWPYRHASPELCEEIGNAARRMLPDFFDQMHR
jgi:dihydrodipicolinate synthase/N-acetylneuraminate lyase